MKKNNIEKSNILFIKFHDQESKSSRETNNQYRNIYLQIFLTINYMGNRTYQFGIYHMDNSK